MEAKQNINRKEIIAKYFTDISLNKEYIDIYYQRKSILRALKENISKLNGTLLDVGCGIMPYKELILNKNNSIRSYIGLDFENSLDPEYALGKPDLFWEGKIIPLNDNTIDSVIATELFEHCPDPEIVMKEILRVLKPGGVLFFTVPFLFYLHLVPNDEYRYTPFSLKRHLSKAGFTNIELTALGGVDASLAQMISIWYQHRRISTKYRRIIYPFLVQLIKMLIHKDEKIDRTRLFYGGSMITGIGGTAYKSSQRGLG